MLRTVKNSPAASMSMEEMLTSIHTLSVLQQMYEERRTDAPEWIADRERELEHEVDTRIREELEGKLRLLKARRASYSSIDEKRKTTDDAIKDVESRLGIKQE